MRVCPHEPKRKANAAATPRTTSISKPARAACFGMTSARAEPTRKSAAAVATEDTTNACAAAPGKMKGKRGSAPATTNAAKVASPSCAAERERTPGSAPAASCSDLSERYFDAPIENPSAKRLAMPRTMMTVDEKPAPAAQETTANVGMMPSL